MENRSYSQDIADAINTFLTDDDWNYDFDADKGLFRFNLSLNGKLKMINYNILVDDDNYMVIVTSSVGGDVYDEEQMNNLSMFTHRASRTMKNGSFQFDPDCGEVSYRVYAYCGDQVPSAASIRKNIFIPANAFEEYGTGIMDIIFGNKAEKEAFDGCKDHYLKFLLKHLTESHEDADQQVQLLESGEESDSEEGPETDDCEALLKRIFGEIASDNEGGDA